MAQTETERLKPLHARAKSGDIKAGKELIASCRRGMLVPDWEAKPRITQEVIEKHLQRREGNKGKALK